MPNTIVRLHGKLEDIYDTLVRLRGQGVPFMSIDDNGGIWRVRSSREVISRVLHKAWGDMEYSWGIYVRDRDIAVVKLASMIPVTEGG